jgi:hypothetical protein
MNYLIWFSACISVAMGLVGTVFPALPGTPLIFAGALLIGWWFDFQIIGVFPLITLGMLAAAGIAIDFIASTLGAKRVGASGWAILGATVGSLVGIFFSIPGIILGPFVGAFLGELHANASLSRATTVGIGTWIGLLLGTVAKVGVAFTMVGLIIITLIV